MTTVREFRGLGVAFVYGDECRDDTGSTAYTYGWYVYGNAGDKLFDQCKVTRFAWRPLNTIPDNPKFKYERTGSIDNKPMWRPLLDQSSVKPSEFNFDFAGHVSAMMNFKHKCAVTTDDKPVFTQAMADAGELPPVGSECKFLWTNLTECYGSNQDRTLKVIAYNEDNTIIWGKMNGNKESNLYRLDSLTLKPLDTRTPKQKAVDDMCEIYLCNLKSSISEFMGDLYDKGYRKQ